jgi:hypothetical protein
MVYPTSLDIDRTDFGSVVRGENAELDSAAPSGRLEDGSDVFIGMHAGRIWETRKALEWIGKGKWKERTREWLRYSFLRLSLFLLQQLYHTQISRQSKW